MILHLATFLQGGAGRCITDLAVRQRRAGTPVMVVASATGEADYGNYPEYLRRLDDAGVEVLLHDSLFKRDFAKLLAVVDRVAHTASAEAIDVMHAHAAMPALAALLLSRHARICANGQPVPVVQTMHGWGTRKTPEQAEMDVAIMRQVDGLVTTSHASKDLLIARGLSASRVTVIPCGLPEQGPDVPRDAPPDDDVAADLDAARARGARVIVCIGSITENKNQRALVEALSDVVPHVPIWCAFIGEGEPALIADLERLAAERGVAGAVRFYGHRPDAAAYLSRADLLVLPSRLEGQGLAVLEAFRAGVLTVVSDTPALTELVTHGETGLVSSGALARTIVDALTLPAAAHARIVHQARERFCTRFTIQAMLDAHAALYTRLSTSHGAST
jgi:L-malate glycosyltransferase